MEMQVDVDTLETDDNLIVYGEKLKEISKNEGKEMEIENQTGNTKPEIKKECRPKRKLPDWMKTIKNDDKKQRKEKFVKQEVNEEIKEQCTLGKNKTKLLDEGVKVEKKEEIKELPDSRQKIEIEKDDEHFDLHKKAKIEVEVITDVKDLDFDDVKDDINFGFSNFPNYGFWNFQQNELGKKKWRVMCPKCRPGTRVNIGKFPNHVKKNHGSIEYEKMNSEEGALGCHECGDSKVILTNIERHMKCMESKSNKGKLIDNSKDIKLGQDAIMGKQIEKETSNKNKESVSYSNRITVSKSTTLKQSRANDPSSLISKATSPHGGNETSGNPGKSICSSGDEDSKFNDCDGEVKMALVVRQDLKMGKRKVADNCCNATLAAYKLAMQACPQALRAWEENGQPKVILKADNEEVHLTVHNQARNLGLVSAVVGRAGKKQIAPGTSTVVAVGPGPVDLVDQLTRDLKKI